MTQMVNFSFARGRVQFNLKIKYLQLLENVIKHSVQASK